MVYESLEGETRSFEPTTFRNMTKKSSQGAGETERWAYIRSWRSWGPPNDKYHKTDLAIRRFSPRPYEKSFSVRLHRVRKKKCTGCSDGVPYGVNTRSPPPWDRMKAWIEDCQAHHQETCGAKSSDFVPSRLLEVGTLLNPILRLRLKEEIDPKTPYFTLSHCWGPVVLKRLMLENLEEFRVAISADGLSKTFQEAIYATQKLGVQYLWIDSLCIIQDSANDWQTEAAMMAQVYAGGLCNLAATAATEGTQGLFLDKLPLPQVLIDIDGTKDMWHLVANGGSFRSHALNFTPLNWRGWVFQERFLSTRILHFGRATVYWECGQKTCCAWPGNTIDRDLDAKNIMISRSKTYWHAALDNTSSLDKDAAVRMWNDIIENYSAHGAFTYETDKLLAIGGIASRTQESIKTRYLAGIWEYDLIHQLMWDVGSWKSQNTPGSPYVAPSWSWASVNVPVSHYALEAHYLVDELVYTRHQTATVHSLGVELVTDNIFGQVKGGFLCLTGRLAIIQDLAAIGGEDDSTSRSTEVKMDREDDASGRTANQQWYLLVLEELRAEGVVEGASLILEHMPRLDHDGARNVFIRAGFSKFLFARGERDVVGALQDEFENTDSAKTIPVAREEDGKSIYLITIV
ncbi:uncharacterized protein DNG_00025 [Cephalotrichum gorgonifer]|uniref:Heterokaryon incompatibility domain-containing protein n=1 Tax=Cephalotrichum gorgonifer TaxID=2041049 RepID=A0AAE8MN70_9PEZI|nr:uncharacterized protein DNG_00025 [Cephalotrichum gorgonifer]